MKNDNMWDRIKTKMKRERKNLNVKQAKTRWKF